MNSAAYRERMQRPDWQVIRERIMTRAGMRCEVCRRLANLEVHHVTYARLGAEDDRDLQALCERCHRDADRARERQTASHRYERAAAAEQAREDAAFETWCERAYGDAGPDDFDHARERFDAWLERKAEREDYD